MPFNDSLQSFVEFKIYISLKPQIEIFDSNFAFYKLIFNCIQKNGSTPIQPKGNIDKSLFELECKFLIYLYYTIIFFKNQH